MSVTVYRCACPAGHFLMEAADTTNLTKAEADALVATLAYTYDPKGQHPPGKSPSPTEDPPEGGSSDSTGG